MEENIKTLINTDKAVIQPLVLTEFAERQIEADVLRLDKLHPVISGNKWFKLKYYLADASANGFKTILTFGGAWSNHIIATAYAARQFGMDSIGIIRGEKPEYPSNTLEAAASYGMRLEYVSRVLYKEKESEPFINDLKSRFESVYVIPEGGAGEKGVEGSREILALAGGTEYSHIICCIGTGTMYTGLASSSSPNQQIIGIPILKGFESQTFLDFFQPLNFKASYKIFTDYHFGGYARKTAALLHFMNDFYKITGISTDFVYTGKLFYACTDLVKKNYFLPGSKLLIIHSGGLQGNSSLPDKALLF